MKVVRTTGKMTVSTTVKTLCSKMLKTARKKLHRGTNANHHRRNFWTVQTTEMRRTTELVPRISTVTATATAMEKVVIITVPEEDPGGG